MIVQELWPLDNRGGLGHNGTALNYLTTRQILPFGPPTFPGTSTHARSNRLELSAWLENNSCAKMLPYETVNVDICLNTLHTQHSRPSSCVESHYLCAERLVSRGPSGHSHSLSFPCGLTGTSGGSWSRMPRLLGWQRVLELTAPRNSAHQVGTVRPHIPHKCTQACSGQISSPQLCARVCTDTYCPV
jgi:hypothetical protein